jgi:hypothetical protein
MLISHLSSVGESGLLDFNHTLPLKEVITKTLNPKWVPGAEATSVSSASFGCSGTDPAAREPVMSIPQFYNVPDWETDPMVDSFNHGLDKLSGVKTAHFHLLSQQLISLFARLLDKNLHHFLSCCAGSDPYATAHNVKRNIRKHCEGQEWINKDILREKWSVISVCISPETTYNELLRVNAELQRI